jgi:hypothetical protein
VGSCQGVWIKLKPNSPYNPSEVILQGLFYKPDASSVKDSYEKRGKIPFSFFYNPEKNNAKVALYDGLYHLYAYTIQYNTNPDGTTTETLKPINTAHNLDVYAATPSECKTYGT